MQDAAAMLSVSPSALRSWERRFGYPAPMRSAGGHRHYPHGEISALRDALEEGLSISSAIGRAREALVGTTPESLTRALLALDYERADTSMEAALALRTLDRAVEDVLLASLAEVGARTQLGSAPWALAAAWATQWLRRARRLCPEPWGLATILVGDATRELELDAVNVRALELLCIRAGASILTLPVHALAGLPECCARFVPTCWWWPAQTPTTTWSLAGPTPSSAVSADAPCCAIDALGRPARPATPGCWPLRPPGPSSA